MEMNDQFCIQLFACALCENLSSLNAPCCCQENHEDMTEITEPRLLKRGNLQKGDILCSSHFEKLKSGMIFGGGGGCCAPFHVEKTHGARLRPLPRTWRRFFESSVPTNRYLPSLQICGQCYNITLDLMLNTESNVDETDRKLSISSTTSSQSTYTSPRRWLSSVSLHMPSGSTSGSTWSLSSSRQFARSSNHLLSLYSAQNEKLGRPRVVPESVKRYFRYRKQDESVQSDKPPSLSRIESYETSNGSCVEEYEDIEEHGSESLIDRTDNNVSLVSQASCIGSDRNKSGEEQEDNSKSEVELTKLTLTPQRKSKGFSKQKRRMVSKLNFSSPVNSMNEEDVFLPVLTQQTSLKNAIPKELLIPVDRPSNKENHKYKVSTQDSKISNIEIVKKEDCDITAPLLVENNSSGVEKISPYPKQIKITTRSIVSSSQAPLPSSSSNAHQTNSNGEITALTSQKKICRPSFTPKRHSQIKYISISPKNNVSGRQENEGKLANDNKDLLKSENTLENLQKLQHRDDLLTSRTPGSSSSMSQDVIKFVIENHSRFGLSHNDVKRLIRLIEKVNPGALQVFARTLAQSIVSFALEDATATLIRQKKQIKSSNPSKSQEVTLSLPGFQHFDDVLGNLKPIKQNNLTVIQDYADTATCEKIQTSAIMSNPAQKNSEKKSNSEKLLQKLNDNAQNSNQNECQRNNSLVATHTSVEWLTEKKCYRTELTLQVKEKECDESVYIFPASTRHSGNFSMAADDIRRNIETSTAVKEQANVFKENSPHLQVIKCVVEDVVPVTRSFSTGYLDQCDVDDQFDSCPPVRSSSTESFFTVTYQVSDEQEKQDNSDEELAVAVASTTTELNKKPESGIFMSMLEADRSCTESVASRMTDYSDFDDDGTFSRDTQNSEIESSPQITTFNDVSNSENFDTAWQSNPNILPQLSAPTAKQEQESAILDNLQLKESFANLEQKDVLESSNNNNKQLELQLQKDFVVAHAVGEKSTPSGDAYFPQNNSEKPSIHTDKRDQCGIELFETVEASNDELSSNSATEANEDVAPSLLDTNSSSEKDYLPMKTDDTSENVEKEQLLLTPHDVQNPSDKSIHVDGDEDSVKRYKSDSGSKPSTPLSEDLGGSKISAFQSPIDQQDEESSVTEQTRRSTVDWFPSDDVLRQRRSNQFIRAISEVALLSNRVRKTKREKLSKTDEDPEEDDVSDIIQRAMEESTPRLLRRKSKVIKENEANDRSKIVFRAVAILGIVGTLLYASWRYYYSSSK